MGSAIHAYPLKIIAIPWRSNWSIGIIRTDTRRNPRERGNIHHPFHPSKLVSKFHVRNGKLSSKIGTKYPLVTALPKSNTNPHSHLFCHLFSVFKNRQNGFIAFLILKLCTFFRYISVTFVTLWTYLLDLLPFSPSARRFGNRKGNSRNADKYWRNYPLVT